MRRFEFTEEQCELLLELVEDDAMFWSTCRGNPERAKRLNNLNSLLDLLDVQNA